MTRLFMTADAVGGVWTYALELAGALAPLGYETTLALLGPAPSESQRAEAAAVPNLALVETDLPLDWLAAEEGEVRETARVLARLARAERADLIQLNQPAFAAEPMPAPVIAVVHSCVATWWRAAGEGPLPDGFRWQTAMVRCGLARADAVIAPSAAFAAEVQEVYRLSGRPLAVHNGRTPSPATAGALHDFVLTAGRLWDKGKNAATLDKAAAHLGVPFKAAGSVTGPHGETVSFQNLHVRGLLEAGALADCYAARPVFASAALYEPFGLAVLEAAQAGCPLVLSDIPTFRELWGDAAIFVTPTDARGFADAIEELIGNVPLRLAQGDLAKARAARFTAGAMAAGMDAAYRPVLGRKVAA